MLIQYIGFYLVSDWFLPLLELQLFFVAIYIIYHSYKNSKNWLSLDIVFIGCICIFLLARIFMHLFLPSVFDSYGESQWMEDFYFSKKTMLNINFILIFSLLFLHLGFIYGYKIYKNNALKKVQQSLALDKTIGYCLFLIGGFCFFYKVYFYFNILNNFGYFAIYSGNYILPTFVRIFDDFFYIGFFIILANKPPKKYAYRLSLFFIFMYSSYIFTGMRAEFLIVIITTFWSLSVLYNLKINFKILLCIVFSIVILSQITLLAKYDFELDKEGIKYLTSFFYQQGVSLLVLGFMFEFKELFFVNGYEGFLNLFAPFYIKYLLFTGQVEPRSLLSLEQSWYIVEKLEYFLNPTAYLQGGGTGSTYIMELYFLGGNIVFLAFFSFFLGIFIIYIQNKLIFKKYGFFIATFLVQALIWMPRSSFAIFIIKFIFAIVIVIFLKIIKDLLKRDSYETDTTRL